VSLGASTQLPCQRFVLKYFLIKDYNINMLQQTLQTSPGQAQTGIMRQAMRWGIA
jgi:hypothetical protein